MKLKTRLDRLVNLEELYQKRAKLELAQKNKDLHLVQKEIQSTEQSYVHLVEQSNQKMRASVHLSDLSPLLIMQNNAWLRKKKLQSELSSKKQAVEQARQQFIKVRARTKSLQLVQQRKRDLLQKDNERKERLSLEELNIVRRYIINNN